MIQQHFINRALGIVNQDDSILGLTVGGSWLTKEIDEYSDLDLVLVTKEKVSDDPGMMFSYASSIGKLLSAFTGEHVGEPRLLICLYDDPLLHVDIKFLTLDEFKSRVEEPVILYDTNQQLENIHFYLTYATGKITVFYMQQGSQYHHPDCAKKI